MDFHVDNVTDVCILVVTNALQIRGMSTQNTDVVYTQRNTNTVSIVKPKWLRSTSVIQSSTFSQTSDSQDTYHNVT